MSRIHDQLKQQRLKLGLQQKDMRLRTGMARQQYQRLEARGNPRLETLELAARGVNLELVLVPKSKLRAVLELIADEGGPAGLRPNSLSGELGEKQLSDAPWEGLLEE
jgi:transcriptional regulator with XRE-family HTH domain